ncbi:DNA-directed RNA polymerase III subunit RPC4 [Blyttiomyces sp. JEL0837]|nr:DNA-directed RNA polymerase III subunit RPC4 [Blyttiomyces sp. JEL0837]
MSEKKDDEKAKPKKLTSLKTSRPALNLGGAAAGGGSSSSSVASSPANPPAGSSSTRETAAEGASSSATTSRPSFKPKFDAAKQKKERAPAQAAEAQVEESQSLGKTFKSTTRGGHARRDISEMMVPAAGIFGSGPSMSSGGRGSGGGGGGGGFGGMRRGDQQTEREGKSKTLLKREGGDVGMVDAKDGDEGMELDDPYFAFELGDELAPVRAGDTSQKLVKTRAGEIEDLDFIEKYLESGSEQLRQLLFVQLPETLPEFSLEGKDLPPPDDDPDQSQKLPEGLVGKIVVRKSGRMELVLGNIILDITSSSSSCAQQIVSFHGDSKTATFIGECKRKFTCTPSMDDLLR